MFRSVILLVALIAASSVLGSRTDYINAKRKFQAIDKQQYKPGSRVAISAPEINAYVETELPEIAPPGVRRPSVELQANNVATGKLLVDFLKLRSAKGKSSSWLIRKLLEGEREVAVTTRIRSSNGTAAVDIQKVEVAGVPISGAALDFLIRNYVLPNYPSIKIGQPFALSKRVDRVEVGAGVAYVVTR